MEDWAVGDSPKDEPAHAIEDDELALLFACCHPALDLGTRVALTLRFACGLPTATIARLLVLPEPTLAQRLVRAKRKVRGPESVSKCRTAPNARRGWPASFG